MASTNEVGLQSRLLRGALVVSLVFVVPGVALSEWFLDKVQVRVNENQGKPWAGDTQRWIGHAFAYTCRRERAAERYGWAARIYDENGEWLKAGDMLIAQAEEYEADLKKYHAIPIYKFIAVRYSGYPAGQKASDALARIRLFGGV